MILQTLGRFDRHGCRLSGGIIAELRLNGGHVNASPGRTRNIFQSQKISLVDKVSLRSHDISPQPYLLAYSQLACIYERLYLTCLHHPTKPKGPNLYRR